MPTQQETGKQFYAKYVTIANTLMEYMKKTISNPGPDSRGSFEKAVKDHPPLWLAEQLINDLDEYSTNPLKVEMDKHEFPRWSTFTKWKTVIVGVLNQFLILEAFLNGIWNGNKIGLNDLEKKIKDLHYTMDEVWARGYMDQNNNSWSQIQKFVHKVQDENRHVGNKAKRDIIQEAFEDMITDHGFTYFVYNDCQGFDKHHFYGNDDLILTSFRRGSCNVVVIRTTWRHGPCKELEAHLRNARLPGGEPEDSYEKINVATWCGHVGRIRQRHDISFGWKGEGVSGALRSVYWKWEGDFFAFATKRIHLHCLRSFSWIQGALFLGGL